MLCSEGGWGGDNRGGLIGVDSKRDWFNGGGASDD
jgi:hypothetical protein